MCSPRSVVSQAGLAKAVVTRCSQLLCDYTMASGERGAAAGLLGWILLQLCRALTIVWTVCLEREGAKVRCDVCSRVD